MLGVSSTDREQALRELPEDEYSDILHRLAEAKRPTIKGKSDYECRMKLMRFLVGRGFEVDIIREVVE